jgi:glycosyltransferase involved in cell wall biosynthesis
MEATTRLPARAHSASNGGTPALDLSVVVPVRNAENLIEECLASIIRSGVREIVLVDGLSTDRTVEVAQRYPVRVLSDKGRGLPVARLIGVQASTSRWVALIDADVVLPDGALAALLREFEEEGYTALRAGLHSVSGPGYWGQALVNHHRSGRSKEWFGVVATIFERDALLEHGFDERFLSGEDIELRWRLERQGARVGVSSRTVVTHRFAEDTFDFAKSQWLADGHGLGRMVSKHGVRAGWLFGLPLAAAIRGILLSLVRLQPKWIPYYVAYMVFNYVGMAGGVRARPGNGGDS